MVRRFIRRWLGVEADIAALRSDLNYGGSSLSDKIDALLDSATATSARIKKLEAEQWRG